jgi:hypothetical protein
VVTVRVNDALPLVSSGTTSKFHHQTLDAVHFDRAPQTHPARIDVTVRGRTNLAVQARFARHRHELRVGRVSDKP